MPFITAHCVSPALPHPTYWVLHASRQESTHERVEKNGPPWEKPPTPWKKLPPPWTLFPTASISRGVAERKNGVLRKKYHVVRKKITSYVNFLRSIYFRREGGA